MIHACYQKQKGSLRVIDTEHGDGCLRSETAIDWNQTGPRGAQGPTRPPGPPGPQGTQGPPGPEGAPGSARDYAVIIPGTTPRFTFALKGFQSVTREGPGTYCLQPDPSIASPADGGLLVSAGGAGAGGFGLVSVEGVCSVAPFAFLVSTLKPDGTPTDSMEFTAMIP